jgi:choline dehydrogenase-like flavoprotein
MTPDLETDVCIVGAGPAGAIVAATLAARGVDVVVLESGPRMDALDIEAAQRRIVRGETAFPPEDPRLDVHRAESATRFTLDGKRVRGVGGASLHWEGYAMRFRPGDFALASRHGLADDWPIDYAALEPYYDRVERELGVAGGGDDACPRSAPYPMPAFPFSWCDRMFARACATVGVTMQALPQARNSIEYDGRAACRSCGTCHVCPIGAKATVDVTHLARAEATGRARVVTRALVRSLECDDAGRVRAVCWRDARGAKGRVRAERVVLAAGAIENVRLCLVSACRAHPDGIANRSGLLGAYFMSQPVIDFTAVVDEPMFPYRTGISTAISRQFEDPPDRVVTGSFWMEFRNRAGGTPAEIALASGAWGAALPALVRERFGRQAGIRVWVEHLPARDNAVRLDRRLTDAFGAPAPHVGYRVGAHEHATIARAADVVRRIFGAIGGRAVRQSPIMNGGILMGTHRMGADPRTSVVDADQRAHDAPNLYLVGSGSFVTGAAAPPTLTLAALAARTADGIAGARS